MNSSKLSLFLTLSMLLSWVGTSSGLQSQQQRGPLTKTCTTTRSYPLSLGMARSARFENIDWQAALEEIATDIQPFLSEGDVASYIPALAQVDPNQFGIAFTNLQGNTYQAGPSADTPFSIQSISKVFALVMALDLEGVALWQRVGREPSGSRFNSIVQLENEQGRPRNPLINAGAIAVTNSIQQHYCTRTGNNQQSFSQEYNSLAINKILDFLKLCAQANQ